MKAKQFLDYPHNVRLLKIRSKIWEHISFLSAAYIPSKEPISFDNAIKSAFTPTKKGIAWGGLYDCAWFKLTGLVDTKLLDDSSRICARIDVGGEGLAYTKDGKAVQGITNVLNVADAIGSTFGKQLIDVAPFIDEDGKLLIYLDCGRNRLPNVGKAHLKNAEIVSLNSEAFGYYYDYMTLYLLSKSTNDEYSKKIQIALGESYKAAKGFNTDNLIKAREILKPYLTEKSDVDDLSFAAIGHAHLDLAWLWPLRETKRKSQRTIANQLKNIERYPDYKFGISQPQQMEWLKYNNPDMFAELKKAVKAGNVELQGGMWVECDCNVPSGESLIRQFLYGTKFYSDEFGVKVNTCWLPDVFGYNGNLPQIIKGCGIDNFFTIKLSWNEVNSFPYHTFIWRGIDGSDVLTHLAPEGTYNSTASPIAIKKSYDKYKEKGVIDEALVVFGAGDGGGGPGEFNLELLKREKSLKGMPKVTMDTAQKYFERLSKKRDLLKEYQGELYLEKHQGTYTTQAKNKLYNRKIEFMLHSVEFIATYCYLKGYAYPTEQLNEIWKEVLLYQFHDILPGSSIHRVYKESVARYEEMYSDLQKLRADLIHSLSEEKKVCALNTTSFDRCEWLRYDNQWYKAQVPAYASAPISPVNPKGGELSYDAKGNMESDRFIIKFHKKGYITSLVDKKTGKEICGEYLNKLVIYPDKRLHYNAWDISSDYNKHNPTHMTLQKYNMYKDGPMLVRQNVYVYNASKLVQNVILIEGEDYVRFDAMCSWHEKHKMLRSEHRPSIYSDKVKCDIQFGNIDRATTENNSVEKAQFEICAHKYINIDSADYGFALINDCKYGYRVKNGLVSMNLLRSPVYPDKTADRGQQSFSYAIYPHSSTFEKSNTVKLAYCFNDPLTVTDTELNFSSVAVSSNPAIVVETIKKADSLMGLVVRLYDAVGNGGKTNLKLDIPYTKAVTANLLEYPIQAINLDKPLEFKPFEIKTIILRLDESSLTTNFKTKVVNNESTSNGSEE